MLGWAKGWFSRPTHRPDALFQPPGEVLSRRDTIDDLIAGDKERLTPAKRAVLLCANVGLAAGALGGNNIIEVRQVWGQQDVYAGVRQTSKPGAAD